MNADIESPAAQAGWRSAGYRLLSQLFRYPDKPFSLKAIEEWLSSGFPDQPRLPKVENLSDLQKEHIRLFHRNVFPFETAYVAQDSKTKEKIIADISWFYHEFGVDTFKINHDVDTLVEELEFMAWLSSKEERALMVGNLENACVYHEAEGKFLREHLGRWLPAFLTDFRTAEANAFFRVVAEIAEAFLRRELDREFSLSWEEISRGIPALRNV